MRSKPASALAVLTKLLSESRRTVLDFTSLGVGIKKKYKLKSIAAISMLCLLGHLVVIPTTANAVTCKNTTLRDLKLISKNPTMHKGKNIFVYGEIKWFGDFTGPGRFLAWVGAKEDPKGAYVYTGAQAYLSGSQKVLSNFVEGDYFKACVNVSGLRTNIDGLVQVDLRINNIKYIGGNN